MSAAASTAGLRPSTASDTALKAAARLWFFVAVVGQWAFLYYIVAFYGPSTLTGNFQAWSKNTLLRKGYVAGDTVGNLFFAAHVLLAAVVTFGGALQLVPQIRARAIAVHRWNGRLFLLTAIAASVAGLYMVLVRGGVSGTLDGHIAVTLNGVLILVFAVLAWRSALRREIPAHRRWALRAYLVANGVWFIRIGVFGWAMLNHGHIGGFDRVWNFGSYLVPLGVLELYLRAKDSARPRWRFAMAGGLLVLTALMSVGIVGVSMFVFRPLIKKAYDNRKSIADALSATLASGGIDQAARQYHALKAAEPTVYDFDEGELNALGYRLIRDNRFKEAIGILQLNVDAYPQSSNAYDSLAEAYMGDGNKPLAIANYQESLRLDPSNSGAVRALQKLNGP